MHCCFQLVLPEVWVHAALFRGHALTRATLPVETGSSHLLSSNFGSGYGLLYICFRSPEVLGLGQEFLNCLGPIRHSRCQMGHTHRHRWLQNELLLLWQMWLSWQYQHRRRPRYHRKYMQLLWKLLPRNQRERALFELYQGRVEWHNRVSMSNDISNSYIRIEGTRQSYRLRKSVGADFG